MEAVFEKITKIDTRRIAKKKIIEMYQMRSFKIENEDSGDFTQGVLLHVFLAHISNVTPKLQDEWKKEKTYAS